MTRPRVKRRAAGFTLIELMVVVVLIAIASAVASLALRDPASTRLDHEGARLVALLEAARTEARSVGLSASWVPVLDESGAGSFRFIGLPASSEMPTRWMASGVTAEVIGPRVVTLGPEPMIGAQRVVLHLDAQSLGLSTDGLGPFVLDADVKTAER